jgi:hypothetical protein
MFANVGAKPEIEIASARDASARVSLPYFRPPQCKVLTNVMFDVAEPEGRLKYRN